MSDVLVNQEKAEAYTRKLKDCGTHFAQAMSSSDGQAGCHTETGTTAVTGTFVAITIISDAVFAVLTDAGEIGDGLVGSTVPAGVTLFGRFSAFTLTSGKVRAYV